MAQKSDSVSRVSPTAWLAHPISSATLSQNVQKKTGDPDDPTRDAKTSGDVDSKVAPGTGPIRQIASIERQVSTNENFATGPARPVPFQARGASATERVQVPPFDPVLVRAAGCGGHLDRIEHYRAQYLSAAQPRQLAMAAAHLAQHISCTLETSIDTQLAPFAFKKNVPSGSAAQSRAFGAKQQKLQQRHEIEEHLAEERKQALLDPNSAGRQLRLALWPLLRSVVENSLLPYLMNSNHAEQVHEVHRMMYCAAPLFMASDSLSLVRAFKNREMKPLGGWLSRCCVEMSMPEVPQLPMHFARIDPHEARGDPDKLHARLVSNLHWILSTSSQTHPFRKTTWAANGPDDAKNFCLPGVLDIQRVLADMQTGLKQLFPDAPTPAKEHEDKIKDCIKEIRRNRTGSLQDTNLPVKDSYFDAIDAMLGACDAFSQLLSRLPAPGSPGWPPKMAEVPPPPEPEAPDTSALEPVDDIPEPEPEPEVAVEPTPHDEPPAARAARPTRAGGASATSRLASLSLQDTRHVPNFRLIPLASTTAALNAMRERGEPADLSMLADIAARAMTNELPRLPPAERDALLLALQPHVEYNTQAGRALTFSGLLGLLRATNATSDPGLRSRFADTVGSNLLVKGRGRHEQEAFDRFILQGGGLELLQQMRCVPRGTAQCMLYALRPFFSESSITPQRLHDEGGTRWSGDGAMAAALTRTLTALAPYVGQNHARLIGMSVATMLGSPLPRAVVQSTQPDAWEQHALRTFMGDGSGPLYRVRGHKLTINPHDAGVKPLRHVIGAAMGDPAINHIRVVVGANTHQQLHGQTLRHAVTDAVAADPAWTVKSADDGISLVLTRTQAASATRSRP